MRHPKVVVLVLATSLVAASSADAAQRFVSPGGSGPNPCVAAAPCSLETGVNSAGTGDEVIIGSGTYTTSTVLQNASSGLFIHGVAGQPRPVINTSATPALQVTGSSGTAVRDLTINHSGSGFALFTVTTAVDRVAVRSAGQACIPLGSTVRDSLCAGTNGAAIGIFMNVGGGTTDIRLRNVTAIGSEAMSITAMSAATISVDARNVIFQGQGGSSDVLAATTGLSATTTLTMQNSNYDLASVLGPGTETVTPAGSGSNQTAAPSFANTTSYEQAAGSPTIDAGATDAFTSVTTDLGGDPRVQGAAIDIGADELTPVVTPPADTTPPETKIVKGPKKKSKSRKATFIFSASEAGSTFVCKVDKKAEAPCASPLKLKGLKKGKHMLSAVATDSAGNADATAASYKWKVKKKPKKR